ncbi:MAG: CsgG/HfaB family protein [bacterium]
MKSTQIVTLTAFFFVILTFSGGRRHTLQVGSTSFANELSQNAELEEAKKYVNDGQTQKAIDILNRLVADKSLPPNDHVIASELLAVAHVFNAEDEKAKVVFTTLIQEYPDYRYPHYQPNPDHKPTDTSWCWTHPNLAKSYLSALKKVSGSMKVVPQSPGIQTIAIIDFENNSIDDAEKYENFGRALAKILITDFSVLSKLQVVERERLQFLIDELELTDKKIGGKNVIDASSAPQIGKLLGAHSFVFGSFMKLGKTFRIDARIVKTETGEIFKTASVDGKPDNILELASKLTLTITKNLEVDVEKVERRKLREMGRNKIPIEAWALLGDAESMAEQEQYKDAYKKLEEALKVAPDFQRAKDLLRVLEHLV